VQIIRGRDQASATPTAEAAANPPAPRQGGLRSRMEDRLRRRFDEN
jgi:hypothetical protein